MSCTIPGHNGIWVVPYQVISSEILWPSQDSTGVITCMLHPPLGRVSRDPRIVLAWTHAWCTSACQSIPRSQYSTGVNTCILHPLVRVSQGPEIPWSLTWVARGVLGRGVCNWDQASWSAKSVLDSPLLKLLIAYFSMAQCQIGAGCSWSAAFHSSEVTLIS